MSDVHLGIIGSGGGYNSASLFPSPVPTLIADKKSAVVEGIASVLRASMPNIAAKLCSSPSYAMHAVSSHRYQLVLCGAQLAEPTDFLLLKQHRAFQSDVPFLLVAEKQDRDIVQRAFDQHGVVDIIVWPPLPGQLEATVRQAMCLHRTRLTLAERQQRLSTLRSDHSVPPKQIRRAIRRIEANLKDLARVVHDCEREAHRRAIERLDFLGRSEYEVSRTSLLDSGSDRPVVGRLD